MKNKEILYITYDGLTSSLGESQVLPYIYGLAKEGYLFTILSFEKEHECSPEKELALQERFSHRGIRWIKLRYSGKPPLFSTLYDIFRGVQVLRKLLLREGKKEKRIVHCRSAVPQFIASLLSLRFSLKILFDTRGFWFDERVDGGIWKRGMLYFIGKRIENWLFSRSSHITVLTRRAKAILEEHPSVREKGVPVSVITTCADSERFRNGKRNEGVESRYRLDFLDGKEFVFLYSGSVGTWYLFKETLQFYKVLQTVLKETALLIVTHSDHNDIRNILLQEGIKDAHLITARHHDIPSVLQYADANGFFILPAYSKQASMPTRMGESLAAGIPVVINKGIGDTEEIVRENNVGVVVEELSSFSYREAAEKLRALCCDPDIKMRCRKTALRYFSLEKGIKRYAGIYRKLGDQALSPDDDKERRQSRKPQK